MSWARVDDAWWSHRKVVTLDLEARGLWVSALSYTAHQREPFIPAAIVNIMGGTDEVADRLVKAGLWLEADGGWAIHDWSDYQSVSAKRAEAGRKGGQKSGEARREATETKQTKQTNEANEAPESKQAHPSPSHPSPTQPKAGGARPRDELWDAVVEVCGYDPDTLTKNEKGRIAKALKQLREVNAQPDEVRRRAAIYRRKYQGMDLTPTALASNWNAVKEDSGKGGAGIGTGGVAW